MFGVINTIKQLWWQGLSSSAVAIFTMAIVRLKRKHRLLSELEHVNALDYWHPEAKGLTGWLQVLLKGWLRVVCYTVALYRIAVLPPLARRDYYALLRVGKYAVSSLPCILKGQADSGWRDSLATVAKAAKPSGQLGNRKLLPVVIVPGLNTPAVFFRAMAEFLEKAGFPVWVIELPNKGLANIQTSADVVKERIEAICEQLSVPQVAVVGHCMGGLITKYLMDEDGEASPRIKTLISLGTGFMGAEGVETLKGLWQELNPGLHPPEIFDQLVQWNLSLVRKSANVAYHSVLTVWDMMVHLPKGMLQLGDNTLTDSDNLVKHHVLDDPAIDHLTLALHPKIFRLIESLLNEPAEPGLQQSVA